MVNINHSARTRAALVVVILHPAKQGDPCSLGKRQYAVVFEKDDSLGRQIERCLHVLIPIKSLFHSSGSFSLFINTEGHEIITLRTFLFYQLPKYKYSIKLAHCLYCRTEVAIWDDPCCDALVDELFASCEAVDEFCSAHATVKPSHPVVIAFRFRFSSHECFI